MAWFAKQHLFLLPSGVIAEQYELQSMSSNVEILPTAGNITAEGQQ